MKRFLFAAVLLLSTAATGLAQDIPLSQILVEGEGWKVAEKDMPGVTDLTRTKIALAMSGRSNIVRLAPEDNLDKKTAITVTEVTPKYENKLLSTTPIKGIENATCIALWPDDSQLVIGDASGRYLWTARIDKDGKLGGLDRYYSLRVQSGEQGSGVKAMVVDARNLLYAATPLGVQVFDPTGRLCGVILPPANEEMTAITIGGKDANQLFIACGDKIYSRKIQGKAAYTLKKEK